MRMSPSVVGGCRWRRLFFTVSIGMGIITSRVSRAGRLSSLECFTNTNAVFSRISQQSSTQKCFVPWIDTVHAFVSYRHHNGSRIGAGSRSRKCSIHPGIYPGKRRQYSRVHFSHRQEYDRRILLRKRLSPYFASLATNLSTSSSSESSESSTRRGSINSNTDYTSGVEEKLLMKHLGTIIGISEAENLSLSVWKNLQDPLAGYDQRFGRPAIRTYRAFVLRKDKKKEGKKTGNRSDGLDDTDDNGDETSHFTSIKLDAAAGRCARQIDFLIKRHRSHETEWIRNHDPTSVDTIRSSESSRDERPNTTKKIFPITLVLDNLRSAMNVGSIFRTAEATGCCRVVTCGITPHPNGSGSEKLAKAALGAERIVSTQHYPSTRSAIEEMLEKRKYKDNQQQQNVLFLALETTDRSKLYTDLDYRLYYKSIQRGRERAIDTTSVSIDSSNHSTDTDGGTVEKANHLTWYHGIIIVLGNEVTGVDTNVLEMVDEIVELPTFGLKNSLNVASCAPVIIFEILRQWDVKK